MIAPPESDLGNDVTSKSNAPITVIYVSPPGATPHAAASCDFDAQEEGVAEIIFEHSLKQTLHQRVLQEGKDLSICVLGSPPLSDRIMVGTPEECGLLPLSLKYLMENYCKTLPRDTLKDESVSDIKGCTSTVLTSYVACQGTEVYDLIQPYNMAVTTSAKKGVTRCRRQCVKSVDDALETLDIGRENQLEFLQGRYLDVLMPIKPTAPDSIGNRSLSCTSLKTVVSSDESVPSHLAELSSSITTTGDSMHQGAGSDPPSDPPPDQNRNCVKNYNMKTENIRTGDRSASVVASSDSPSKFINIDEVFSSQGLLRPMTRKPLIEASHSLIFSFQIRKPTVDIKMTTGENVSGSTFISSDDHHLINGNKEENVRTLCSSVHFITFPDVTYQTANTDFDVFEECLDAMLTERRHRQMVFSDPPSSTASPFSSPLVIQENDNINVGFCGGSPATNSLRKSSSFSRKRCTTNNKTSTSSNQTCSSTNSVTTTTTIQLTAKQSPKTNLSHIVANCNNRLVTALAPTLEMGELQMGTGSGKCGLNSVKKHVIFIICLSLQDFGVEETPIEQHNAEPTDGIISSGVSNSSIFSVHHSALRNFGAKISQILRLNLKQYEERNENHLQSLSNDDNTSGNIEINVINDLSDKILFRDRDQQQHKIQDKDDYYCETDVEEEIEKYLASPAFNHGNTGEVATTCQTVVGDSFVGSDCTVKTDEVDNESLFIPSEMLEAIPIPLGWERQFTDEGKEYFVDHINKITTWEDPRRKQYLLLSGKRNVKGNIEEVGNDAHAHANINEDGDVMAESEGDSVQVSPVGRKRLCEVAVLVGDRTVVKGDPEVDTDYAVMWEGERVVDSSKDGSYSSFSHDIPAETADIGIMVIDTNRKKRRLLGAFHFLSRKKSSNKLDIDGEESSLYISSDSPPQDEGEESIIIEDDNIGWLGEDVSSDEDRQKIDEGTIDVCPLQVEVKKEEINCMEDQYSKLVVTHSDSGKLLEEDDDNVLPNKGKNKTDCSISSFDMSYQVGISTHILELITRKINDFCPAVPHSGGSSISSAYLFSDCTDPILRELLPGNERHYLERIQRLREKEERFNTQMGLQQQHQEGQGESSFVVESTDKSASTEKEICDAAPFSYKRRLVRKSYLVEAKQREGTSGEGNLDNSAASVEEIIRYEEETEEEWQERQLHERDELISLLSDFESMLWRAAASEKLLKELLIQKAIKNKNEGVSYLESTTSTKNEESKEDTFAVFRCPTCGSSNTPQLSNMAVKALSDRQMIENDASTHPTISSGSPFLHRQPTNQLNATLSSNHTPDVGYHITNTITNGDFISSGKDCATASAMAGSTRTRRRRARVNNGKQVVSSTTTHVDQSNLPQFQSSVPQVISSPDRLFSQVPPEEIKKIKDYYRLRHDAIFQALVTKQGELVKKMYADFNNRVEREKAKVSHLVAELGDAHRRLREASAANQGRGNTQLQMQHNTLNITAPVDSTPLKSRRM